MTTTEQSHPSAVACQEELDLLCQALGRGAVKQVTVHPVELVEAQGRGQLEELHLTLLLYATDLTLLRHALRCAPRTFSPTRTRALEVLLAELGNAADQNASSLDALLDYRRTQRRAAAGVESAA
jgi:hypothetical protein